MARKRDINPDLWTDAKVLGLPWPAVGFYVGLITQADDEGRLEWDCRQLTVRICGVREDVRPAEPRRWMEAIARAGLVVVYEARGRRYAAHPNWRRHQYVNRAKPSHLPGPDDPGSAVVIDHASVSDASVTRTSSRAPVSASASASGVATATATVARASSAAGPLEGVRAAWNAHRGPLPEVTKVPERGEVRDALVRLNEEAGGDLAQIGRAVVEASRDPHYREHRYGLVTFARHYLGRWAGAGEGGVGLNGRQAATQAALERFLEEGDDDQARVGGDRGGDHGAVAVGGPAGGHGASLV